MSILKAIVFFYIFSFVNGVVLLALKTRQLKKSPAIKYYFFQYIILLLVIGEFLTLYDIYQLPFFCYPDLPVRFLFTPFLYLYTVTYLNPAYRISRRTFWLLFLPAIIELAIFTASCIYFSMHSYTTAERSEIANGNYFIVRTTLAILFNLTVTIFAYRRVAVFSRKVRDVVSSMRSLNYQWIKSILNVATALWYFWLLLFLIEVGWSKHGGQWLGWLYFPLYMTLALVILVFGYFALFKPYLPLYYLDIQQELKNIEQPVPLPADTSPDETEAPVSEQENMITDPVAAKDIISDTDKPVAPAESNTAATEEAAMPLAALFEDIERLLEKEKLFSNPDLTLQSLADKLDTSSYNISQAIKLHSAGGTFYRYINTHRLRYFMLLLQKKENRIYTLHTIGQMAGFNSRTTFTKYCKEVTGLTPAMIKTKVEEGYSPEEIFNMNV